MVFLVAVMTSLAVAARLTRVIVKTRPPEHSRQWSASRIPRIGGIAIFAAIPIAILAAASFIAALSGAIPQLPELAGALIIASAILFIVGLLDDIRGVPPVAKLTAQAAAAIVVYYSGFSIGDFSLFPGYVIQPSAASLPLTIIWLVGISNAFNLVDGLDGLAGGVAIVGLAASAAAALILGNGSVPIYTVALIGALLGFLRYNFPKARLFLGDSGSLVVGFLLAVLAVKGATDSHGVTLGLVPIFALAYPLLDTGVSILRRWLRGVPLSRADHRHIHHQLRALELSPKRCLLVIYSAAAASASVGLLVSFAPPQVTVVATLVGVAALILAVAFGIHWLEYHEFLEARSSLFSAARNARSVIRDKIHARDMAQSIRQANSLEEVQAILNDGARRFRFAQMKLSDSDSRRQAPGRITQELQALKLWKLEYPIVQAIPAKYDGLCLTIWCALEVSQRPAGAERVAQIIGPAIVKWVSTVVSPDDGPAPQESLVLRQTADYGRLRADDPELFRSGSWESPGETSLEA
jgi:UDP-GlcNAc:undecaprenyl-phosphate GlcNAc-1-phosphate transferase